MERDSFLYKARRQCQVIAHKIMPDEVMCKFYSRILLKKKVDLKNPQTLKKISISFQQRRQRRFSRLITAKMSGFLQLKSLQA